MRDKSLATTAHPERSQRLTQMPTTRAVYVMEKSNDRRNWPLVVAAAGAGALCVGTAVLLWMRERRIRRALNGDKDTKFDVVFVLGGPGAGKGTQCALLVEQFGLVHLSAGDLLREERKSGGELGQMIETYIKEGKIVPAEVTVRLLRRAMEQSGKHKFLIDGFPRNTENLFVWLEKMTGLARIKGVLCLHAPEDVMLKRLLERGKTSGRTDDNEASIKKRFRVYHGETKPIIDFFRGYRRVCDVTANRSKDEVYDDCKRMFSYNVVFVLGGPGSGKGTMSARIVDNFGYVHLSAGDLLRAERNSGGELAEMIETYIRDGKIVPAEVTVRLLRQAMEQSGKRKFLVDGFPRNTENFSVWNETMVKCADVRALLFLDCPEHVMEARLLERGKTSGRSDDNIESIRKRFRVFLEDTMPIVRDFDTRGKARKIGADRSMEEVYADVHKTMAQLENDIGVLL